MKLGAFIDQFPLYFQYFLKQADEHSIQAPFAYTFYKDIIKDKRHEADPFYDLLKSHSKNSTPISKNQFGAGSKSTNSSKPITLGQIIRSSISPFKISALLVRIARFMEAATIVELGTSAGINTLRLANFLPKSRIFTFEGNPDLIMFARKLLKDHNYRNVSIIEGDIDNTLAEFVRCGNVADLIYIDANHQGTALKHYFNLLRNPTFSHQIVVVDDIRWSSDMFKAWSELCSRQEVRLSFDLGRLGILLFRDSLVKQHYIVRF
ncbi:MAG: O-methyltransferase [Cyclobacteriaceae bacterium]